MHHIALVEGLLLVFMLLVVSDAVDRQEGELIAEAVNWNGRKGQFDVALELAAVCCIVVRVGNKRERLGGRRVHGTAACFERVEGVNDKGRKIGQLSSQVNVVKHF